MTALTRTAAKAQMDSELPDNTSSQISPEDVRENMKDLADSAAFPADLHIETLASFDRLQQLTDGATISWDVESGMNAIVTLGGNRTVDEPTNVTAGMTLRIIVVQDGTGSRTITWDSFFMFPGGTAPTLTTSVNRADVIEFLTFHDGTNYRAAMTNSSLNFFDSGWTPGLDP